VNKRIFRVIALICVGALLFTGCGSFNTHNSQISDMPYAPDTAGDAVGAPDDGADTSHNENANVTYSSGSGNAAIAYTEEAD